MLAPVQVFWSVERNSHHRPDPSTRAPWQCLETDHHKAIFPHFKQPVWKAVFPFAAQAKKCKQIFQNSDLLFRFSHESQGTFSSFCKFTLPGEPPLPQIPSIHSLYKYQVNPCWLTRYNAMGWEEHRIQWPGTWASESSRPVSKPQTGHRNSSHTNSASAVQSTSCALICLILAHYEQLIMLPFNRCERPGTEQLNNLPKLPELKGGRIGVFLKFYWYTIYIR